MNATSKQNKDEPKEALDRLDIWQSIDTWDFPESVWEKKQKNVENPWRVNSVEEIDTVPVTGRPVFPHSKVLGRTPFRWFQIIVFYIIFYLVLFLFTYFCYFIFDYLIRPKKEPMYTDILAHNRAMTLVPNITEDFDLRMVYSEKGKSEMEDFFKNYLDQSDGEDCSYENPITKDTYCKFDIDQLGPCVPPFEKKCFIIRLNRIYNWKPEPYESSLDLPSFMPQDLKNMYEATPPSKQGVVWTSCYFPKEEQKKYVKSLKYHPSHSSFPGYYFPFTNQKKYIDPLVAVEIDIEEGSLVFMKCRNWAKNIDNNKFEVGSIEFKYTVE